MKRQTRRGHTAHQITEKNPRGAGAPRQYEQPPQRIQIRATDEELARIKAALDGRRMTEAMLARCDEIERQEAHAETARD